jgi:hypothetical protein
MDARSVTLCLLHTALKWPNRLDDALHCVSNPPSPDPIYAAIWRAVMNVRSSHRTIPPAAMFREQVLAAVQLEAPAFSSNAANWIAGVAASSAPTEQYCMDLLRRHAKQRLFESMPDLVDADAEREFLDRIAALDRLSSGPAVPGRLDLFANDGRDYLRANPIIPTGFFLMDHAFGGLFPVGREVLYVIPTKSGKTLFSLQLAKHLVERRRKVLYMNFEQEAEGDLATRIYMMATDTPKALWDEVSSFSELPEDVRVRLTERIPEWNQYFYGYAAESFEDPQALCHGADSISHLLKTTFLDQNQTVPDLVIVDWWKELWERCRPLLMEQGLIRSPQEDRAQEFLHFKKLKLMAQALETRVVVFMQMRAALLSTNAAYNIDKLTCFDAAENHALPNYADAGIVATRLNPNDAEPKITFKLDLCRFSRPGWRETAILDGEYQLFRETDIYNTSRPADMNQESSGLIAE